MLGVRLVVDFALAGLVLGLWMNACGGLCGLVVCRLGSWLLFKVCGFLIVVFSVIAVTLCDSVVWCCCLLLCLIVLSALL